MDGIQVQNRKLQVETVEDRLFLWCQYVGLQVYNAIVIHCVKLMIISTVFSIPSSVTVFFYISLNHTELLIWTYLIFVYTAASPFGLLFWQTFQLSTCNFTHINIALARKCAWTAKERIRFRKPDAGLLMSSFTLQRTCDQASEHYCLPAVDEATCLLFSEIQDALNVNPIHEEVLRTTM